MAKSLRREISSIRSLYASWYRLHKIFVFQTERDHPKNVEFIRKLCWGGLINIHHFLFVKCEPYLMSCKNLSIEGEEETGKWRGSPPECHTFWTCQNKPKPEMTPKSQKLFVTTITQMNCKSDLIAKTPRYRQERVGVYCSLSICVTLGLVFWRKRLWVSFPVAVRSINFMSQFLVVPSVDFPVFHNLIRTAAHTKHRNNNSNFNHEERTPMRGSPKPKRGYFI